MWTGIDIDTVMTMTTTMENSSAITSLTPKQAGRSVSTRQAELVAESLPLAQVGPDPPLRVELKQSSIPAGDVPLQGHIKSLEAIVLRDLPPEPVQVLLIAPLTVSLNGMRAIVDSKAAPLPAALLAEDPVAVKDPAAVEDLAAEGFGVAEPEDSMVEVEYVAKG